MNVIDIHTHHSVADPSQCILNSYPTDFQPRKEGYYSVGIHPWNTGSEDGKEWELLRTAAHHPQTLAVGEAGLDRLKGADMMIQKRVFERQALLAEEVHKPLVIHCVRAFDELLSIRKRMKPTVPWIIHGFRGNAMLAQQVLNRGFYLSFGKRYHEDAICLAPSDRLLMETDDSQMDIHELYHRAATLRSVTYNQLLIEVGQTINRLFF